MMELKPSRKHTEAGVKMGLDKALEIAVKAHTGQKNKFDGKPYIEHVIRVVSLALQYGDEYTAIVAALHDVVEDTSVTLNDLLWDFPFEIVNAVDRLTRKPGQTYKEHIILCKETELSRRVKLEDIIDHLNQIEPKPGMHKRYREAKKILES